MAASFYTNEAVSLEREAESKASPSTPDEAIDFHYDIKDCVTWIKHNGFKKVCLQFPDFLLSDSTKVAQRLQQELAQTVYILGDTAYGSCCVDYIAAAHVDADAIIHFGPKCFSKPSEEIPSRFVHEKHGLDVKAFAERLEGTFSDFSEDIIVVYDMPYTHVSGSLKERLEGRLDVIAIDALINVSEQIVVYVGRNDRKLLNFCLIYKPRKLFYYEEARSKSIQLYEPNPAVLKKRHYLTERVKDSKTVGIIVGTLAVKSFLEVIDRIKKLLSAHKKKYYIISVGKPTIAKLANFPEMDIYVLIGCALNEIYESRDFYKPIVTPHDIESALNPLDQSSFSFDFNGVLSNDLSLLKSSDLLNQCDVSLLTGSIRYNEPEKDDMPCSERSVAVKNDGSLIPIGSGAEYLKGKSWKGLQQDLGNTEVTLAEEGRTGIARGYVNEVE